MIYINSKFSTNEIIEINGNYNYNYDDSNNSSHIYKFYNNYQKFKEVKVDHNKTLDLINDKFNISGVNSKQVLEPYSSFFPAVSGKLKVVVQLKSQQ